jgi:4-amino-4-deoxy-L-arabinose transferase-like glycosyltransferase
MKQKPWVGRIATGGGVAFIAVCLVLHFLHPRADFPNFSPWMDYAKYTDEGWYGSAAVSYFIRGGWYVAGDFNPAVALPTWPFLEWILFHFTGVSLAAARVFAVLIFSGNVVLAYALVRSQTARWAGLLAAGILASNAFLYCFSRLAILEPLLIFLMLLSWWLSLTLPRVRSRRQRVGILVFIGLLLCGMVLTKTTAIFVFPSVAYLLWIPLRRRPRALLSSAAVVGLAAAVPWLTYYFVLVKPHYLQDYRYLFTANVYPQPTNALGWLMAFWYAAHGALWIDPRLVTLTAALVLLSLFLFRGLWRNPLFVASLLAIGGYLFFIGFHNNMQPRYYQVVAFPLVVAAALAMHAVAQLRGPQRMALAGGAAAALALSLFINTRETAWFVLHPTYTFVNAAENLTRYIDEHPNRNRMLLSISGSNISLVTGLPAICDDFGTLNLPDRIRKYQPGWYAAWNELDPGTLEDLHTQYSLTEVANFPAYDDEDRNRLILYRLTPVEAESPRKRTQRKRRSLPMGAQGGKPAEMRRIAE